jgi:hypothetical protein
MRYIYVLRDNDTNIRYVGQTNDIDRRFNAHINGSFNKNRGTYKTHKSTWIRKMVNSGYTPTIDIIEECETLDISNDRERYYIEKLTNEGHRLTNSHSTDVTEFSTETRKKMSDAKKGKTLEEIVGKEKSIKLKKEHSKRMILNNPNRCDDIEVCKKISNTLKKYFEDKTNHWAYGKVMTEEHNEKLRQSKLNNPKNIGNRKPRTKEQKEKLRNAIKGTKVKRYKILQFNLNGVFLRKWNSLREIERVNNTFNRQQISKCCKGIKEVYGGFIWKYDK